MYLETVVCNSTIFPVTSGIGTCKEELREPPEEAEAEELADGKARARGGEGFGCHGCR